MAPVSLSATLRRQFAADKAAGDEAPEEIAQHQNPRAIGGVFGRHAAGFERARSECAKRFLRDQRHRVIPP